MATFAVTRSRSRAIPVALTTCALTAVAVAGVWVWHAAHPVHRFDSAVTGQVMVSADGRTIATATTWTGCEKRPRLVARETDRSVELTLRRESHATAGMLCDDASFKQVATTLTTPLESKALVSATDGLPIAPVRESDLAAPRYLPTGYAQTDDVPAGVVGQWPPSPYEKSTVPNWTRIYRDDATRRSLTITQVCGIVAAPVGPPAIINGHAGYLREAPSPDLVTARTATWSDGVNTFVVVSHTMPNAMSLDEFLKIAEGLG